MSYTLTQWLQMQKLPKLEARMLLQHITGYTQGQLITRNQERLPENQLLALNALAQRREQGEPMAYILGNREFYGRTFSVSSDVLIPRHETEHLIEAALCRLPERAKVLDLGTGSGIIAITLQCERPDLMVYAGDISEEALRIAQKNVQRHQAAVQLMQGSWFQAAEKLKLPANSLDMIVSNPPYIEQDDPHLTQGDLRFEPLHALTDFADGLTPYRELAAQAPRWLKSGGWLIVEHGYNQGQVIHKIFQAASWQNIATLPDLAGLDRITLAQFQAA